MPNPFNNLGKNLHTTTHQSDNKSPCGTKTVEKLRFWPHFCELLGLLCESESMVYSLSSNFTLIALYYHP